MGRCFARLLTVAEGDWEGVAMLIRQAERAFEALSGAESLAVRVELAGGLSLVYSDRGFRDRALAWADKALALAEQVADPLVLARAVGRRARALFFLGRHEEAVAHTRRHTALAEASGDLAEQAAGLIELSCLILYDDLQQAKAAAQQGIDIARRVGHRGRETVNLMNCVQIDIWIGDWAEAARLVDELLRRRNMRSGLVSGVRHL
jgi:tetratricopeptide (TPR) repeat protein